MNSAIRKLCDVGTSRTVGAILALSVVIAATVIWPLIAIGYAENTDMHMWINLRHPDLGPWRYGSSIAA